jgi:hypothetical protein
MKIRRRTVPRALQIGAITVVGLLVAGLGIVGALQFRSAASGRSAGALATTNPASSATAVAASGGPAAPTKSATPGAVGVLGRAPSTPRASASAVTVKAGYRNMTFVNALQQTIWLAATRSTEHPLAATGWTLHPGQSINVAVPDQWGGRFWGRTGCAFDGSGRGHCETGDCGGRFQCEGSGATPATLAEFALSAWGGMDFYDVSMVDGSNVPMWINITRGATKDPIGSTGCVPAGCTRNVACPSGMQVKTGTKVVACTTACAAFGGDAYCCQGKWAGRDNCKPTTWPVNYAAVFKTAEPYAYSYAFDDSATMPCKGGCYYRITFGVTSGASEG